MGLKHLTVAERELLIHGFWRGVAAHARHIGDATWRQRADELAAAYDEQLGPTGADKALDDLIPPSTAR